MATKKKTSSRKKRPPRPILGRPTILTPEIQKRIVDAIKAGAYVETAAAYAGVGKSTFFSWMTKGRKGDKQVYKDFVDAVERAMAAAEMRDVVTITRAAESQWQAAAWRLERKFPSRWGRRQHLAITGEDGGPVEVEISSWADLVTRASCTTNDEDTDGTDDED